MFKRIALAAALTSSFALPLTAQEKGQIGFVIQTPVSVGIIWDVTERLALRPDVNFSRSSNSGGAVDNTVTSWTAGLGMPLYMSESDNLRSYISPRFSYNNTKLSGFPGSSTQSVVAFSASYGVQWAAMKRLHFFGEVGPQYSRTSNATADGDNWGLRSSLGLALYSSKP